MKGYSENAKKIYEKLYLQEGETIEECHARVASYLAVDHNEWNIFKDLLDRQIFRINTPAMTNAGVKENPNLCACFILGLEDSMESIIDMWGTCARIYEGGGGAGIPITNLRPKDAPISSGGCASGPISYMEVVQSISDQVKSGGRSRRAANLISLDINHKDIRNLITCKNDKKSFSAMNLSVLVKDEFMKNKDKELWSLICKQAHSTGDPGMLFYDRVNKDNPFPSMGDIASSNPCGEIVGMPWTSCVLGHINLNKVYDKTTNEIDYDLLGEYTKHGVLMLNRILEKTHHPHPKFREVMSKTRPIGLGIMGLADLLYKMDIQYGSKDAQRLVEEIMEYITYKAFNSSSNFCEKGIIDRVVVPEEDGFHFNNSYLPRFTSIIKGTAIGNSTVTCIAPTGSTSISADCSYGFEPAFALVWQKQFESGETWPFINEIFSDACHKQDIDLNQDLLNKIIQNKGSIQGLVEFPKSMQDVFVTAHDVSHRERIDMQAAAQKFVTMSISSTVNLPNSATVQDVEEIFNYAWEVGLKGITIYRDGCLDNQPVDFGGCKEETKTEITIPEKRPSIRTGKTVEVKIPSGKLYVTGNSWDGSVKEFFISMSYQDSKTNHLLNSYGRLLSRSLQAGVPINDLLDTMRGGGGEVFFMKVGNHNGVRVSGLIDALAYIIDVEFMGTWVPMSEEEIEAINNEPLNRCPECGKYTLRKDSACRGGTCINDECFYSNCM